MHRTARLLLPLAVISFAGCRTKAPASAARPTPGTSSISPLASGALVPSPRLLVGHVIAVDVTRKFAFIELASDAPAAALTDGTELIVRTLQLRETARVQTSRQLRGRTLGTRIISGQPSPGDEVVWLAP